MAGRGEIHWKLRTAEGEKYELRAHLFGGQWRFSIRKGRFDRWELLPQPSLEDWLRLLDAVERRIPRRLMDPQEADRLRHLIRKLFPEAKV